MYCSPLQLNTIPGDLILDYESMVGSSSTNPKGNVEKSQLRRFKSFSGDKNQKDNNNDEDGKKKMMHRDIERQRRQEMATLCASLRSLLPVEYIKGKRAASDHVNEAVNYIKDLQKRIEELSAKRDGLKKLDNDSSTVTDPDICSSGNLLPSRVIARPCVDGVEVVITTGVGVRALKLSRVIQVLLQEGLDVVNCVSTKVDGRLIHTVRLEDTNLTGIDVDGLQQKLNEEIPSSSNKIF